MKMKRIYSQNAEYQKFEVLRTNRNKRYKYNAFLVEGVRNINEAIRNGWHICSLIYSHETPLSGWAKNILASVETDMNYELTVPLMASLSGKTDTSELLAIIQMREDNPLKFKLSENPLLVLFDRPSNKGNLGTIIRSCDALGAEGLMITGHSVDVYDYDVIVSSMGSFFKVPVARIAENNEIVDYIKQMKSRYPGFITVGTTAHAETTISDVDLTSPLMILIGNETHGLSNVLKESCDVNAAIPMSGGSSASSLNVACAATVALYEAGRQRIKNIHS